VNQLVIDAKRAHPTTRQHPAKSLRLAFAGQRPSSAAAALGLWRVESPVRGGHRQRQSYRPVPAAPWVRGHCFLVRATNCGSTRRRCRPADVDRPAGAARRHATPWPALRSCRNPNLLPLRPSTARAIANSTEHRVSRCT